MFTVLCGRWETYPREFAKCRRCRKAKYCGKECQSTAWSEGHRFWCSAKDGDDDPDGDLIDQQASVETLQPSAPVTVTGGEENVSLTASPIGATVGRPER